MNLLSSVPQPSDVTALAKLLQEEIQNELQCREFLRFVPQHLCRERPQALLRVGSEEPSRFGLCDFVVSAEISHGASQERFAYVWELKAPQLYLYEMDNNLRRFRPTIDLLRAETQLFHYAAVLELDDFFKDYYDLRPSSKVVPAGIIMGRRDRFARSGRRQTSEISLDQMALAQDSHRIRKQYMYDRANILIKTWDWVVELMTHPSRMALD